MQIHALPAIAYGEGVALCNRQSFAWILGKSTRRFVTTSTEGSRGYAVKKPSVVAKTLRVMQLTAIILTVCCLSVTAKTVSQTITYSGKDVTLTEVLDVVKQQTGYFVIHEKSLLKHAKPISITAENMPLADFMDRLLADQPFTYTLQKTTLTIERRRTALMPRLKIEVESPPVSGVVRDAAGIPLSGATVMNKRTKKSVQSNANGEFSIEGEEGDVLQVSFIGYENQDITVKGRNVFAILKTSNSPLDEVQVIAYGTTTQRLSTGNVSTVKAKDIEKQPVGNPLLALQGRVPGLMIIQSTGLPGSGVTVRIQGQNSIANGKDPFYVIDGVPFPSQNLSTAGFGSILGSSGDMTNGNPLSFINPKDIESIEILKDADATAIYGSRAANGAILITTKKGKIGQTKVDLSLQNGIGKVAKKLKMMNTQQYLEMRREAIKNDELTIPTVPTSAFYDLTLYDQDRYTDWQKVLIGNPAKYTDAQASLSGGNANVQGLFGVNYHKETTVYPGDFADQKGSAHFNLSGVANNHKFQYQFTGSYMIDNNKLPARDLTTASIVTIPNAPALYDANGNINWEKYNGATTWQNPVAINTFVKYNNKTTNLLGNANLSYEFIKGLQFKSSFGYNRKQTNETSLSPLAAYPVEFAFIGRMASYGTGTVSSWIIEPQLNYLLNRNYGKIDFLLGTTLQHTNNDFINLNANGFTSDVQLENIMAAPNVFVSDVVQSEYNYNALFGRVNYNYQDKYILNVSARRDGSSRFGPANLFHDFYGIAGAWLFSNEKWIHEKLPIFSYGKLKASYGTTGNDQIGDYAFMSLYGSNATPVPYGGGIGNRPAGLSNPYLQWEETRKLNMGIDLGVFNNRILINLNYYRNRSSNQLVYKALPIITGFPNIRQNFDAKVQNSGLEMSVSAITVKSANFNWSTSLNLSFNRNKLLEYRDLASSGDKDWLVIGRPITITRYYEFAGVDSQTGLYQFKKADGTLTSSPAWGVDNFNFLNISIPKYFGGVSNSFTYREFTLDVLLQFVNQKGIDPTVLGVNNSPGYYSSGGAYSNQPTRLSDHWREKGEISQVQKFTTIRRDEYDYASASDIVVVDASYVRLKNVSASWFVPKKWLSKLLFKEARIYLQGQNLLTFTKYKGLDPETSNGGLSLPPLRVWTFGFQITL